MTRKVLSLLSLVTERMSRNCRVRKGSAEWSICMLSGLNSVFPQINGS